MDLDKSGKLLLDLRKGKGLTQKQVAEKLHISPKTISKWETGKGFPDISLVANLADVLGVSTDTLLSCEIDHNEREVGNMKKIKFYICPECGNILQAIGNSEISCCGKKLEALKVQVMDEKHQIKVEEIENEHYITIDHSMAKDHYISFVASVGYDRVVLVKLYPEQEAATYMPRVPRGKILFYCNEHGLFGVK